MRMHHANRPQAMIITRNKHYEYRSMNIDAGLNRMKLIFSNDSGAIIFLSVETRKRGGFMPGKYFPPA
jgi:hypothetical protein